MRTIPGLGEQIAQVIIAKTGADMARFPSATHLAAWVGLVRANDMLLRDQPYADLGPAWTPDTI